MTTRNMLFMHNSFFVKDDKKVYISSLRFRNIDDEEKVEVSFVAGGVILHTFSSKKLTIKVTTQKKIDKDVVVFEANGKVVQRVYSKCLDNKEIYSKYITTLIN